MFIDGGITTASKKAELVTEKFCSLFLAFHFHKNYDSQRLSGDFKWQKLFHSISLSRFYLFNLCHMLARTMNVICQIMELSVHSLIFKSSRLPPAFKVAWAFNTWRGRLREMQSCVRVFNKENSSRNKSVVSGFPCKSRGISSGLGHSTLH